MADLHKNFVYGTVSVAPSPATTGTTFSVTNAIAANFPTPTTPYNVTVWPTATQPSNANAEIWRITAKGAADSGGAGHTQFTITRIQESSTARSSIVGDQIAATITVKTLTDIEEKFPVGAVVGTTDAQTLTNKTLTSPVLNTPTFSAGAIKTAALDTSAVTQSAVAFSTAGATTANTAYEDLAGATATITTTGGNVLLTWSGIFRNTISGSATFFQFYRGATALGKGMLYIQAVAGYSIFSAMLWVDIAPTAGSTTFKVQWKVNDNTSTCEESMFTVTELKK